MSLKLIPRCDTFAIPEGGEIGRAATSIDDLVEQHNQIVNQNNQLITQNNQLINTLKDIINSAVHPDTAVRAVMVDLKPIRAVLKPIIGEDKSLGI